MDQENKIDIQNQNASNSTEEINKFYFYATEQLAVLWTLFILIVFGNATVILALSFSKNRKSRMNYFIMQLAAADLAVGLISVSTDIVWRITITWHAGNVACKLIRYLQALVTYASTYVLVALSIDRYDAIKHPMKFSRSWRRARVLVGIAWALSALFSLPSLIMYREELIQDQLQCWIEMKQWEWRVYMTVVSLALFVIPAVIITACYTVIVSTIWSKGSNVIVLTKRTQKGMLQRVRLEHEHECRRASSRGLIPRAKVKTIKMTFVIVFVFIICWSPYIIFDLLQVYDYVPKTQTNLAIATFVQSLAPLNSAANPLIYCLFSTRISRGLRKFAPFSWLFRCCCPSSGNDNCLGYAGDMSSTLTSSITLQSKRGSTNLSHSRSSTRKPVSLVTLL
ncbi:cardioacceleratory peptide receptor-like [Cimex lectularius]|uniref:G-protein coupled receptors family 1 profile domain-containing protein n=1 Tax=Cimex lectularius TaxID=79782 RepID=A0A8I6SKC4_CIMLE|nr:cardioacceleratory peptide receptor-like [Cimex lectularius]XP_024083374.1 cardioacceleratory peptide receptor-like [Cimex lectularius]XP_024083375.1 cardioacceleratory peptide receptor-like [Cimex lectularius]XP_024083378.1 cardioacceleratory peptide receptor-like [Cimex lectularius]